MTPTEHLFEQETAATGQTSHSRAADIAELLFNDAALEFAYSYRASSKLYCPRCRSDFIRKINSGVFRELNRCVDCNYMFNCLAGTIFQGTKISMVRFFQAIILYDVSSSADKVKNIAFHTDVSQKTARAICKMVYRFRDHKDYAFQAETLSPAGLYGEDVKHYKFLNFCETKKILIDREQFLNKIRVILDTHRDEDDDDDD